MSGFFKTIRMLWAEYQSFGRHEIEQLRARNDKLRADIETVRKRRLELDKIADSHAIKGLQVALQELETAKQAMDKEKELVLDTVDKIAAKAAKMLEQENAGHAAKAIEGAAKAVEQELFDTRPVFKKPKAPKLPPAAE